MHMEDHLQPLSGDPLQCYRQTVPGDGLDDVLNHLSAVGTRNFPLPCPLSYRVIMDRHFLKAVFFQERLRVKQFPATRQTSSKERLTIDQIPFQRKNQPVDSLRLRSLHDGKSRVLDCIPQALNPGIRLPPPLHDIWQLLFR